MNKIFIRGVVLSIVVVLLLVILLKSRTPFGKDNSSFATDPQKKITRIEFSEDGHQLFLLKEGENWLINGKTEARKSGILFILRILQEIKIKSPVSPELFDNEITGKGIAPVKVRVFEKRKLIKTFLVYKTRANIYGNVMKIKEGSKPFIVYVPGFEGDIGSGFNMNELFWQPYTVFNLLPSEIARVELENLTDSTSSFTIVNNNNHYAISDRDGDLTGWDSTLVTRYLSYFTWIPFESWAFDTGTEEKKIIESRLPMYRISVTTNLGVKTVLTLWEKMSAENGSKTKDSDRLFGKTQTSNEFFIIRYFDIDPLLKKRLYFFPE
jgi:hypothetical protein